jgi:hypothetical protein
LAAGSLTTEALRGRPPDNKAWREAELGARQIFRIRAGPRRKTFSIGDRGPARIAK